MSEEQATSTSKPVSTQLWAWGKWGLLALVLYFVGQKGCQLYQQQSESLYEIEIRPVWLILAGGCSFIAWLPSVWFWQRLMVASGEQADFWPTARAYYCGHLGKYIPGKVSVLLIRATLMKEFGVRASVSALTAAYETLAVMGVGLVIFLGLVPYVIHADQLAEWPSWIQEIHGHPRLVPVLVIVVLFVSLPLVSRLLDVVSEKLSKPELERATTDVRAKIPRRLLYVGVFLFICSWMLHGLSLGLVLASLEENGVSWKEWPLWTAAISAAFSLGFAAIFAPAGLGVREGLIAGILAGSPAIGPVNAFVAALLIRIITFASEILTAVVLYYSVKRPPQMEAATISDTTTSESN